jgi:hypothetical protein
MSHEQPNITENIGLTKASDKRGLENPLMEINGNWDILDDILSSVIGSLSDTEVESLDSNLQQLKINMEGR